VTVVSFADVAVDFGGTTLLRNVGFTVAAGECWGIVGRNGAGKTTLFRLITGDLEPTRGVVFRPTSLRIALLDQLRHFGQAVTVWDAAAAGYREAIALERQLADQAERMAELGEQVSDAELERFGRDQERFAHLGGYEFHSRVDAVLQGLRFDPVEAKTRPLDTLSGGERGRVGLAAPLAAPADLLLLDEPTNHLDLDTIRWLTEYLGTLGETVMVISHDRAFLDDTADHVLHVANSTATPYRGGYSAFVTQRGERELSLQRAYDKQRAVIDKEEDYIRRHIAGQNSAQAKGRRTRLNRLPRLSPPAGEAGAMGLRLQIGERGGDQVVVARHLSIRVADRYLLTDVSVAARRGDIVALIGPNGVGKTTLLATLLGEREPADGSALLGASITPAWYRQDLAGVPVEESIFDVIHELRPHWNRGQVQGHLGAFGFSGEEVQRSTSSLSGGEQARVALAMITLARANLLVLDEPTNHLDVESIEVLEDAIEEYEGTVLLVSHDRAFLRELTTRVWSLEGGRLIDYQGPFVEWEVVQQERHHADGARAAAETEQRRETERIARRRTATTAQHDSTARNAARKREALETEVAVLENRIVELETQLAEPSLYAGLGKGALQAAALGRELAETQARLEVVMRTWSRLAEES
jgi:ATP-binding cassette subfamily F protein 3